MKDEKIIEINKSKSEKVDEGWRDWVAGAALGAATLGANAEVVKIMPGQTVYSIARAFGTDVDSIKLANPEIKDITKVPAGTEIKIPVKFVAGFAVFTT